MKKILVLNLFLVLISCGLKQNPLDEDLLTIPPSRIIEYTNNLYSLENNTEKLYQYSKEIFSNEEEIDSIDIIERGRDRIFSNKVVLECLINPKNIMWDNLKFQDSSFKELLNTRSVEFQKESEIKNILKNYNKIKYGTSLSIKQEN